MSLPRQFLHPLQQPAVPRCLLKVLSPSHRVANLMTCPQGAKVPTSCSVDPHSSLISSSACSHHSFSSSHQSHCGGLAWAPPLRGLSSQQGSTLPRPLSQALAPRSRDLRSCPLLTVGTEAPPGVCSHRRLVHLRTQPGLLLRTCGLCELQARLPASRPQPPCRPRPVDSPPQVPAPDPLVPSGHSPPAFQAGVLLPVPAQSCSAPGLTFLKHNSNCLEKQPLLHNQKRQRPFSSSLLLSGPAVGSLSSPPTRPGFQPHQLACLFACVHTVPSA